MRTVGDLFADKYGSKTVLVSSIVLAAGYLPWIEPIAVIAHRFNRDSTFVEQVQVRPAGEYPDQ